jgi:hypothetical protein
LKLSETVYSYSRLDKYETCPFSYHCRYNLKLEEIGNDWGVGGGLLHDAVENVLKELILPSEASDWFYYGSPILFFDNMREGYGEKWVNDCIRFLDNLEDVFNQFEGEVIELEEEGLITMGGRKLKLFADVVLFDGKDYYIWDWKTSGIDGFRGKKFDKKKRQLYIYARYIKEKYGKYPKSMTFYMARYNEKITEQFSLKEYNKVDKWVDEVATRIENDTIWEKKPNWFFCHNICGQTACPENGNYKPIIKQ